MDPMMKLDNINIEVYNSDWCLCDCLDLGNAKHIMITFEFPCIPSEPLPECRASGPEGSHAVGFNMQG